VLKWGTLFKILNGCSGGHGSLDMDTGLSAYGPFCCQNGN
jgi:hypothetical protein